MILDELLEFADNASLINNAGSTYVLGDVIDLGSVPTLRDIGPSSDDIGIVVRIGDTAVAASGGAANITWKLVSDSVAALSSSPTTHLATAAIAKATMVAGYTIFASKLPYGSYERYLGVTYAPDTNNITAGTCDAFLTRDIASWTAYPNAI